MYTQTPIVKEDGSIVNRIDTDYLNYGTMNQAEADKLDREIESIIQSVGRQSTAETCEHGYETVSDRIPNIQRQMQEWEQEQTPAIVKPAHDSSENADG